MKRLEILEEILMEVISWEVTPFLSNNGDVPSTNYGVFDNWAFKLSCNFDIPDLVDEEVCEGENQLHFLQLNGACDNCTYQWDSNGGNATTNSITVTPTDTTTYVVIVTNANCCPDTTSVTVIWHPTPIVDLGPDMEVCPNESIQLNATTPTCTYDWSTGETTPTINPTMAGTYTVTLTCGPTSCTALDEIIVDYYSVNSPQNVSVEMCQGDSLFLNGAWQFLTGNYSDTYLTADGCDSIVNTNLVVHPIFSQNISMEICQGDSIFWKIIGNLFRVVILIL